MVHHPDRPYAQANARIAKIREALSENDEILGQLNSKAALNTNTILRYLVETTNKIETDLIQLHAKIQPVLRDIQDDSNWRGRLPREENE